MSDSMLRSQSKLSIAVRKFVSYYNWNEFDGAEKELAKHKALIEQAKDWIYVEHPYECNSSVLNLPCHLNCEPDKVKWLKEAEDILK